MPQNPDSAGEPDGSSESGGPLGPPGYDPETASQWAADADHWQDPDADSGGEDDVVVVADEDTDSGGVWLEGEIEILDETPPRPTPTRRSSGASGVVAAAMLGLGEILEPEKTKVEIVQVDDQPLEPPAIKLDFSDVPTDDREPPDNKAQL